MVTTTMKDFGFVESEKRGSITVFKSKPRMTSNNLSLLNWFTEVLLSSHPGDAMPFEDISRQYCVFPFYVDIPIMELYKNEKIEVHREGLDQLMVEVKSKLK